MYCNKGTSVQYNNQSSNVPMIPMGKKDKKVKNLLTFAVCTVHSIMYLHKARLQTKVLNTNKNKT